MHTYAPLAFRHISSPSSFFLSLSSFYKSIENWQPMFIYVCMYMYIYIESFKFENERNKKKETMINKERGGNFFFVRLRINRDEVVSGYGVCSFREAFNPI